LLNSLTVFSTPEQWGSLAEQHMKSAIERLARDRKGATAVEYGLVLALIVLAMIAALILLASTTVGIWNDVSDKVTNAS
jgi:pilus assembly protein Flp/PilA